MLGVGFLPNQERRWKEKVPQGGEAALRRFESSRFRASTSIHVRISLRIVRKQLFKEIRCAKEGIETAGLASDRRNLERSRRRIFDVATHLSQENASEHDTKLPFQ